MSAYPEDAACAGDLRPLWDATVIGEDVQQRESRLPDIQGAAA